MADDDASINRATQTATRSALDDLTLAARHIDAAAKPFGKPVGLVSYGDLARKLRQRPGCAQPYQELVAALAAAKAAVDRAEKAANALRHATGG
jgi:hypothetical protein